MATITSLAFAEDTANDTTTVTNAAVTAQSGDWLVVFIACENSGASGAAPTITLADSDGLNTYTQRAIINHDPGGVNEGATLGVFTCQVTDSLTSATITATFNPTTDQKCIQVYRVRPASGEVISHAATSTSGSASGTTTHSAPSVTVDNGNIIFGAASLETDNAVTGDADTTNGSWAALVQRIATGATDDQSTSLATQSKTVTATGTQAWAGTTASSQASARTYIVLAVDKTLTAAVGSYTITGTAASPHRGRLVVAAAGSYVFTGTDITLSKSGAKAVNVEPGQYDITGTDASTLQGWKVDATTGGSYAITGTDPSTLHGYLTVADPESYVFTGTDTPVLQTRKLVPDASSYAFTGTDVGLVKSGTFVIVAGPGSYAITGTDATTIHGYKIAADAGSYALTGTDATLPRAFKIFFDAPGSYLITGTEVVLDKTEAAPVPLRGTLRAAPYSFSLILSRPPSSIPVVSHIHSLEVDTIPPTLGVSTHIFTLKVR